MAFYCVYFPCDQSIIVKQKTALQLAEKQDIGCEVSCEFPVEDLDDEGITYQKNESFTGYLLSLGTGKYIIMLVFIYLYSCMLLIIVIA